MMTQEITRPNHLSGFLYADLTSADKDWQGHSVSINVNANEKMTQIFMGARDLLGGAFLYSNYCTLGSGLILLGISRILYGLFSTQKAHSSKRAAQSFTNP